MKKQVLQGVLFSLCSVIFFLSLVPAYAQTKFVTIGTGAYTGVYYPTGCAIAQRVNSRKQEYGIRILVEKTKGSVYNVNAVMKGELEFGIVQSDRQYQAVNGLAEWKDKGAQTDLRSVFALYPESVMLVAAVDAGIRDIRDLKGERVNIGNPGSGQRQNAIDALEAAGIDYTKDIMAESFKPSEASHLLQSGRIDAFFYTVGNPSGIIAEATTGSRKVRFATIANVEKLATNYSYYVHSIIPVKKYPGADNNDDVETFGVKATLVTSAKVSNDIVYAVTREVFENFDKFTQTHPAYSTLTKKSMLEGLSAPLHPGAILYFKEAGLL